MFTTCISGLSEDVSIEDLAITQVLSMDPDDYVVEARQAVAAKRLERAEVKVVLGRAVTYVVAGTSGLSKAASSMNMDPIHVVEDQPLSR